MCLPSGDQTGAPERGVNGRPDIPGGGRGSLDQFLSTRSPWPSALATISSTRVASTVSSCMTPLVTNGPWIRRKLMLPPSGDHAGATSDSQSAVAAQPRVTWRMPLPSAFIVKISWREPVEPLSNAIREPSNDHDGANAPPWTWVSLPSAPSARRR
jgi:hypothetical protein